MTSKFSIDNRELLQRISNGEAVVGIDFGNLIVRELAAFRLAAMDSEPFELPLDYLHGHKDGLEWAAQLAEANHPETGDWLYDDPIELAKAIRKGQDMPPAQPAPVVPPECVAPVSTPSNLAYEAGWNACRAAMLQASPVCTCPSGDGSLRWPCPVHPGNSPAQSDCCPAQNSVNPAQGGNYLVIPDEMTSEQAYEIGYYYGDPVDVFARGANWMRQHIIDSTLAAAPQSPGSEPATVPGKWIPVSERMPPSRHGVLVGRWWGEKPRWCCKWATYIPGHPDAQSSGWLIPGGSWTPTHWMELPAATQEVR